MAQTVGFVDVQDMARWIQQDGVENILADMVGYLEEDYARWPVFDKIPRIASHSKRGVIELMPISDGELYSFKYVNGHPSNPMRGFQTVTAFGALAKVDNGYPEFIAEMTLLTALRTAATSVMVAKKLARPDSKRLALIGAGSQSEFQTLGFHGVLGIEDIVVYDIDPAAMEKFRANIEPLGLHVTVASSVDEAVDGADIVTTCTADKAQNVILTHDQIKPGMHINAIGGDCPGKTELEDAILDMGPVFVEFEPQSRIEGEIQHRDDSFKVTEFWEVLTGKAPGRTSSDQITIFDSVGFAINDFSGLRCARDRTAKAKLQTQIDIIAAPDDPKDLFSLVKDPVPEPLTLTLKTVQHQKDSAS